MNEQAAGACANRRVHLDIAEARLCCVDFGGAGVPILLVHGLAGRGNEWWSTARWLTNLCHVWALDQRGHGMSDKRLGDFSRAADVRDIIGVIEQLNLAPVVLVGQSMGGLNAFLTAARRLDLVRGLIVAEASPARNPRAYPVVRDWLASWPLPFPTLADARAFFGGETLYAQTWLKVLEERVDDHWPQFETESMLRSIEDLGQQDYWREWDQIRCSALIVGGANSTLIARKTSCARWLPTSLTAHYQQIPNAGHDLHLQQPEVWRVVVTAFLSELSTASGELYAHE